MPSLKYKECNKYLLYALIIDICGLFYPYICGVNTLMRLTLFFALLLSCYSIPFAQTSVKFSSSPALGGYDNQLSAYLSDYETFRLPVADIDQFLQSPNYKGRIDIDMGSQSFPLIVDKKEVKGRHYTHIMDDVVVSDPSPKCKTFRGMLVDNPFSRVSMTVYKDFFYGLIIIS